MRAVAKFLVILTKALLYLIAALSFLLFLVPTFNSVFVVPVDIFSKLLILLTFIGVPSMCIYSARKMTDRTIFASIIMLASAIGFFVLGTLASSATKLLPNKPAGSGWDDLVYFGIGGAFAIALVACAVLGFLAALLLKFGNRNSSV